MLFIIYNKVKLIFLTIMHQTDNTADGSSTRIDSEDVARESSDDDAGAVEVLKKTARNEVQIKALKAICELNRNLFVHYVTIFVF